MIHVDWKKVTNLLHEIFLVDSLYLLIPNDVKCYVSNCWIDTNKIIIQKRLLSNYYYVNSIKFG